MATILAFVVSNSNIATVDVGCKYLGAFFLKGTVGQSPPATKYINKRGRTNKLR
jgi:hypothetical protein